MRTVEKTDDPGNRSARLTTEFPCRLGPGFRGARELVVDGALLVNEDEGLMTSKAGLETVTCPASKTSAVDLIDAPVPSV